MIYNKPSLYVHIISGCLVIVGILYLTFSKFSPKDPYQIMILILLCSIAIGVHGISHMGLEALYGYNPYVRNKETIIELFDCPFRRHHGCPFRQYHDCPLKKLKEANGVNTSY
jgi:hypothetical protein